MNLDSGIPTDQPQDDDATWPAPTPEPKRHFELRVPDDARIKGFANLSGERTNTSIWEENIRDRYRTR